MSIKRINEFPEGSGSLSNDDIFLFMDDPSGFATTKKISLSQISNIIGGGGTVTLSSLGSGIPNSGTFLRGDGQWVDMVSPANLQLRYGTYSQASGITPLQGEPIWITDKKILRIGDGETIGGYPIDLKDSDSYVICQPGDNIEAKYVEAAALTPNNQPLSNTNRACLIIMPGKYIWSNISSLLGYVDILGLGSYKKEYGCETSVIIDTGPVAGGLFLPSDENVRIKGVHITGGVFSEANSNNIYENCNFSTGSIGPQRGTYINCNNILADGTLITCINCSILDATVSTDGRFVHCSGNMAGTGDHINCIGYFYNNTGSTDVSYTNCVGSSGSFAGGDPVRTRGKVLYCRLTAGSFAPVADGGVIRYSLNGSLSGINSP
jgi:hypothetical protein